MDGGAWKAAVHGVTEGRTRLSDFSFTFHFHALEKEMATHSSVLAWRSPGTGEPGGLPSMGSHRVGHDWSDLVAAAAALSSSFVFRFKVHLHRIVVLTLNLLQRPEQISNDHVRCHMKTISFSQFSDTNSNQGSIWKQKDTWIFWVWTCVVSGPLF